MADGSALLREDLQEYKAASNLEFNEQIKKLIADGRKVFHFGFGQSPFPAPQCFVEALRENVHRNAYLSAQGTMGLREGIIAFHKHFNDFDHFNEDGIVIAPGSKELIFEIFNVFGGDVLLPSPSWTTYEPQTHLCGRNRIIVPCHFENKFLPLGSDIEKAILTSSEPTRPKLLLINNPNNPTGANYTLEQIEDVARVCRQYNVTVVSDEIYARLTENFTSFAKICPERTVVTTGFSKWASAGGWRMGYALFPRELTALCKAVCSAASHTYTCAPTPMQYAVMEGLKHTEEIENYIKDTRRILKGAGDFAYRELMKVGVKCHPADGTYYFMPDFECVRSEHINDGMTLCERMLREINVALMPCDPYYLRPNGELTVRFCFINFDGEKALKMAQSGEDVNDAFIRKYCPMLAEGVDAIAQWVEQHKH